MIIQKIELRPPNLAEMGVKRRGDGKAPDLQTIWISPYPVITRYKIWCDRMGWKAFGGGDMHNLGSGVGVPTSGYRDLMIGGRQHSPHRHALALDCYVPTDLQKDAALEADKLFARIGIYPDRNFMHLDLMPDCWMTKFAGRRYWVQVNGIYKSFNYLNDALEYATKEA